MNTWAFISTGHYRKLETSLCPSFNLTPGFRVILSNILALMKVYIGSRRSLKGKIQHLGSLENQSTANDEVLKCMSLKLLQWLKPILKMWKLEIVSNKTSCTKSAVRLSWDWFVEHGSVSLEGNLYSSEHLSVHLWTAPVMTSSDHSTCRVSSIFTLPCVLGSCVLDFLWYNVQTQVCSLQVIKSGSAVLRRFENTEADRVPEMGTRVVETGRIIWKNHFWKMRWGALAVEYLGGIASKEISSRGKQF